MQTLTFSFYHDDVVAKLGFYRWVGIDWSVDGARL